jgi:NAD(P)H-quinone oxidoreductase subunit 5
VAGTLAAAAAVTAATWLSASAAGFDAGRLVGALILGLAVAPAMTAAVMGNRPALGIAVGIPAAYVGWHWIAGSIVPAVARSAAPIGAAVVAGVSFTMLAALQWHVAVAPQGRVARALYPHAQAGFHLDEIFTRLTFRIWPPRLAPRRVFARRASVLRAVERAA